MVSAYAGGYKKTINIKGVEPMKVIVTGRNLVITEAIRDQDRKSVV